MRITRDVLLKVMRDAVSRRTRADRNLIAAYLCGSLLDDDYLLGGVTDIDLVYVHSDVILAEREIQPITDEVHLDIAHHFHRDYRQTRQLRVHPWLGPTLKNCLILYDPQHLLDFTQASVRGQYDRPDHVLQRIYPQVESARKIWAGFHALNNEVGPEEILTYLKSIRQAACAIAGLTGKMLTERRFMLLYRSVTEAIGHPGLYAGMVGLLGGAHAEAGLVKAWMPAWQSAYHALSPDTAPVRLHALRESYYLHGLEALIASEQPQSVLWPLLNTWTLAISKLPKESPTRSEWQKLLETLGLFGTGFQERLMALDAYLDLVEEIIEKWARENGAEYSS